MTVAILAMVGLVACVQESNIDMVKAGTMTGYETTTIGKAFEAAFDEPAWKEFQTDKGEQIVEFTGKVGGGFRWEFLDWAERLDQAQVFYLAQKTGVKIPEDYAAAEGLDKAREWAIERIWAVGTPVKVQWTLLVGDKGDSIKINYFAIGPEPVELAWVLALIF